MHNGDQSVVSGEYYEGPFLPPETLAKYEDIQKGLVDRIFNYAESEQKHRRLVQEKLADNAIFTTRSNFYVHCLACVCITLMYIAMLLIGGYALYLGYVKTAITILAGPIIRVLYAMTHMTNKSSSDKPKNRKDK